MPVVRDRVFDRWLIAGAAAAVEAAIQSIGPAHGGAIAVIGEPRLARMLARSGRAVTLVAAAKDRSAPREPARGDALAAGSFAVVVGCHAGARADWEAVLAEWSQAIVDGGGLVLVDRASPVEVSRRALCSGLSVLEQRTSGRWVVTSGLVSHF